MTPSTYGYDTLVNFATLLGEKAGLPGDRARVQAEVLLEADLTGHTTHGLALLPGLLKAIETGGIRAKGEPIVISDHQSTILWDANSLPGTWMITQAIAEARRRIPKHPVVTFVLQHVTHVAALGAYLRQATDYGLIIMIMASDPTMRTVAPAGSKEGQLAPNPLAFGYPTENDPILIDISTSAVANGWVRRWGAEGRRLPAKWIQDSKGEITDDPAVLFGNPPGSMLPLGGIDMGHKGFALGLIVEALTAGLSGVGRSSKPGGGTAPVFLQLIDPGAFAGTDSFKKEGTWLAEACRASKPRSDGTKVRMPGDTALALRRDQLAGGVALYRSIMPDLKPWADKFGVTPPKAREDK